MTEENKEVIEQKQEEVTPDKWEEQAVPQGWRPKEEWEGDPSDWRPAREFVERGELFNKIESQNKELKQLRKVLDTLKTHHLNVKKEAFDEAIAALKDERDTAKRNEDISGVIEATEKIDALKEKAQKDISKAQQELDAPAVPEPTQLFKEWHKENPWYDIGGSNAMSVYADSEAIKYLTKNSGATESEVFAHVTEAIRKEFPERFKKEKPVQTVEGSSGSRPHRKSDDDVQLTDEQRRIMDTLVKSGAVTKEQYLKDIKKFERDHG